MRTSKFSTWIFTGAALAFSGSLAMAQNRYWEAQDLREDYRDLRHDYAEVDRLRADIARDQYRLNQTRYYGNPWEANRIARDIARDRAKLNALLRDIAHDRRDIHHDERELYWNRWSWR
jgi:hypothetical protein